jgi:hypothetical protein
MKEIIATLELTHQDDNRHEDKPADELSPPPLTLERLETSLLMVVSSGAVQARFEDEAGVGYRRTTRTVEARICGPSARPPLLCSAFFLKELAIISVH